MSTSDSGRGLKAGPTPELQSDFANRPSAGSAPQNWGANALSTQKSEVAFMVQGAGRPGQPGQRSIFGGNGPVFAQMPSYTPVTRGPAPQAPEPQQPSFTPYISQPASPPDLPESILQPARPARSAAGPRAGAQLSESPVRDCAELSGARLPASVLPRQPARERAELFQCGASRRPGLSRLEL